MTGGSADELTRLVRNYEAATGHFSFAHMAQGTDEYKALVAAGPGGEGGPG